VAIDFSPALAAASSFSPAPAQKSALCDPVHSYDFNNMSLSRNPGFTQEEYLFLTES
jgi:hypothetical protein